MTQYDLWLSQIPGIGSRTILRMREALNGASNFAQIIYEMSPKDRRSLVYQVLAWEKGTGWAGRVAGLLNNPANTDPKTCAELLEESGIRFVMVDDPEYPQRLLRMEDPPFGLYCRGRLPSDFHPSVGIVGTRMASPYGRDQARIFARELAAGGVQIISGMARGIDGIAGRGALDAGGDTFAVLGCGVDICYPRENLDLYGTLCEKGGVLSEYPPGTQPQARLFPPRNRIISGLSDVVLVIEAREKSGTLITVDRALEYGIDVFALPGRVSDRNSAGCNNLIRQGAGIATCPGDILEYLFGESDTQAGTAMSPAADGTENAESAAGGTVSAAESVPRKRKSPSALSMDFEIFGREEDLSAEDTESANLRLLSAPLQEETMPDRAAAPQQEGADISVSHPLPLRRPVLTPIEQAVLDSLDESAPKEIDDLLTPVSEALSRRVSFREMVQTITRLSLKGMVQEVRVGNYVCVRCDTGD